MVVPADNTPAPSGTAWLSCFLDPETIAVVWIPSEVELNDQFTPDGARLYIGAVNSDLEAISFEIDRPTEYVGAWKETLRTDRGVFVTDRFLVADTSPRKQYAFRFTWQPSGSLDVTATMDLHTRSFDCIPSPQGGLTVAATDRQVLYCGLSDDNEDVVTVLAPQDVDEPYAAAELYLGRVGQPHMTRVVLQEIRRPYVDGGQPSCWHLVDAAARCFVGGQSVGIPSWQGKPLRQLDAEAVLAGVDPNAGTLAYHLD